MLEHRRRELGLTRAQAAIQLRCDPKTLMWWERNAHLPIVSAYPAIIAFLGYEPWPEPRSLDEALLMFRKRHGLDVRKAAALIGVDEATWSKWEHAFGRPQGVCMRMLAPLLGHSIFEGYPQTLENDSWRLSD